MAVSRQLLPNPNQRMRPPPSTIDVMPEWQLMLSHSHYRTAIEPLKHKTRLLGSRRIFAFHYLSANDVKIIMR